MVRSRDNSDERVRDWSLAFGNVKNQIAYCGLWCGSCSVGNGTLNELALKCSKTITDYGVDDWGPKGVDYDRLLKGLAILGSMRPCVGCLKGGGKARCEIRACALERGVKECVVCGSLRACKNSKFIRHMRTGALGVGMKVKDKSGDQHKVVERWIAEKSQR